MNTTIRILPATLALLAASGPAYAMCTTSPTSPALCRGSRDWGNGEFGSGYSLRVGFQTKSQMINEIPPEAGRDIIATTIPDDYAWIGASFDAYARMFGSRRDVVDAALIGNHAHQSATARAKLEVMGITIHNETYRGITIREDYTRVFAKVSAGVPLGPITVSATAEASGSVGIEVLVGGGLGALDLRPKPYATVDVAAIASANLACGSVGVRGDLNAVILSLPSSVVLTLTPAQRRLDYVFDVDYRIRSLDGSISIFGDFCGWGDEYELISWNGYNWARQDLYARSGHATY